MIYTTTSEGIRIFKTSVNIQHISEINTIDIDFLANGYDVDATYAYSLDGKIYQQIFPSLTLLLDELSSNVLIDQLEDFKLFFKISFTIRSNRTRTVSSSFEFKTLKINNIDLTDFVVEIGQMLEQTIVRTSSSRTLNPYKHNDNAKKLYDELSIGINDMFGFEVIYFRTESSDESKSITFKLYELNNVVEVKKLKLSIKDNEIPEALEKFDEMGFDFQNELVIHIVKNVFQQTFGTDKKPNSNDFIYLPLSDKMYQLNSPYDPRTFMQFSPFWEVMTTKYEQRSTVIGQNEDDFHKVDDLIDFTDDYLKDEEQIELDDAVKNYNEPDSEVINVATPLSTENTYSFSTNSVDANVVAKSFDFYQKYDKKLLLTCWVAPSSSADKILSISNDQENITIVSTSTGYTVSINSATNANEVNIILPKPVKFHGFVILIDETTFEATILVVDSSMETIFSETVAIRSFTNQLKTLEIFGQIKYNLLRLCKNPEKYNYQELLVNNLLPAKKDFVVISNATPILNIK